MNRLLLHDLDDFHAKLLPGGSSDLEVVSALPPAGKCVGCFGCWVRTPGVCVIADRARGFAAKLGACDEFIIASRLVLGGPSPDIKAFLDRNIPYLLPYFEIVDGVMRHARRYETPLSIRYYYYLPSVNGTGAVVLSGSDGETRGQSLKQIAADYEKMRTDDDGRPSEGELDLMRRIAEAHAKNLRVSDVSVEFIGTASDVAGIRL